MLDRCWTFEWEMVSFNHVDDAHKAKIINNVDDVQRWVCLPYWFDIHLISYSTRYLYIILDILVCLYIYTFMIYIICLSISAPFVKNLMHFWYKKRRPSRKKTGDLWWSFVSNGFLWSWSQSRTLAWMLCLGGKLQRRGASGQTLMRFVVGLEDVNWKTLEEI